MDSRIGNKISYGDIACWRSWTEMMRRRSLQARELRLRVNQGSVQMDSSPTKNVVAYWIFTVLAALLFAVPGAALLLRVPHFTNDMAQLGYPTYFLTILGVWKLLGVIAILCPGLPRLKEWAYAGMIFDLSSAAISRTMAGNDPVKILPPLLAAVIVIFSWRLRPIGRAWRMASPGYGEQS